MLSWQVAPRNTFKEPMKLEAMSPVSRIRNSRANFFPGKEVGMRSGVLSDNDNGVAPSVPSHLTLLGSQKFHGGGVCRSESLKSRPCANKSHSPRESICCAPSPAFHFAAAAFPHCSSFSIVVCREACFHHNP